MKWKLLGLVTSALLLIPLAGLTPGCSGPDNPTIAHAPFPPPPKPHEVKSHVTRVGSKKFEYGAHPKYKAAMDRLNK